MVNIQLLHLDLTPLTCVAFRQRISPNRNVNEHATGLKQHFLSPKDRNRGFKLDVAESLNHVRVPHHSVRQQSWGQKSDRVTVSNHSPVIKAAAGSPRLPGGNRLCSRCNQVEPVTATVTVTGLNFSTGSPDCAHRTGTYPSEYVNQFT